jgi:hypothetical protein
MPPSRPDADESLLGRFVVGVASLAIALGDDELG